MSIRILQGDCRQVLATLPAASVHCCVTSPPYFGLRDYGMAEQIGLEQTPEAFVAELVAVFREVRRVLRDDGTLWLNLGDSYANDTKWGGRTSGKHVRAQHGDTGIGRRRQNTGLKSKDLIGIPWRVAFALQADGWYLRQDIIWSKPNPMPESVTDRCTKAHEYVFLLSKGPRYYFDAEAVKEPVAAATITRLAQDVESQAGSDRVPGKTNGTMKAVGGRLAGNVRPTKGQVAYEKGDEKQRTKAGLFASAEKAREAGGYFIRNKRSVWTIATQPFSESHFATMPPELAETCIKAGCPGGGTVLDPFGGAGTTGLVADRLQRDALLIELNPEYAGLARRRIQGDAPLFADVEVAA
jgi:DNA modification methylase